MSLARMMLITVLMVSGPASGRDLGKETEQGWEQYLGLVRAHMESRLEPSACFLWADEAPGGLQRLRNGEILVAPATGRPMTSVPGGLIHHWIGAVFIPDVSLGDVLSSLQDYKRYPQNYPDVVDSRLLSRSGSMDRFWTLERHKAMFSTIALDADISSIYTDLGKRRGYGSAHATRLQQIEDYGGANQRELGPNAARAYLWRLDSITRYEERDGGVFLELETMVLSRDIPVLFRWLVAPFVRSTAAESMKDRLRQTRDAVSRDRLLPDRPPGTPGSASGAGSIAAQE